MKPIVRAFLYLRNDIEEAGFEVSDEAIVALMTGERAEAMNFTSLHAHAIIEMDDHSFSEGLGCSEKCLQAWDELVKAAEKMTGIKTDFTKDLENKGRNRWESMNGR